MLLPFLEHRPYLNAGREASTFLFIDEMTFSKGHWMTFYAIRNLIVTE